MSGAKHTPGPWRARRVDHVDPHYGPVRNYEIDGEDWWALARISVQYDDLLAPGGGETAGDANARLIAAAPDLLEAVLEMVGLEESQMIDGVDDPCPELQQAYAAVLKAWPEWRGGYTDPDVVEEEEEQEETDDDLDAAAEHAAGRRDHLLELAEAACVDEVSEAMGRRDRRVAEAEAQYAATIAAIDGARGADAR